MKSSNHSTVSLELSQAYLEPLLEGNRQECRRVIDSAMAGGLRADQLLNGLIWPTMELLQSLYREDRITISTLNLATRLNRALTDQLAMQLVRKDANGKRVLIVCGDDEPEELGGQICADLFEADGFEVRFAGGGVPNDEVLKLIGELRPSLLILFGTLPSGMPQARKLIDYLREVNSCPNMQILCCGGIYKRAEGLAEEIGADLSAEDAVSALKVANTQPQKRFAPEQQTVGRTRRLRRAASRQRSITNGDGGGVATLEP